MDENRRETYGKEKNLNARVQVIHKSLKKEKLDNTGKQREAVDSCIGNGKTQQGRASNQSQKKQHEEVEDANKNVPEGFENYRTKKSGEGACTM